MAKRTANSDALAIAETTAGLAHDVGKYLTRVARNLDLASSTPPPPALLAMLIADLYGPSETPSQRPHAVFRRLRQALPSTVGEVELARCDQRFAELDDLSPAVARGEAAALTQAIRAALAIDADLRALAIAHQVRRSVPRGRR